MTLSFNKQTQIYLQEEAILAAFVDILVLFNIRRELQPFWNRMRRVI
jgi:hypothetical protein